MAAATTTTTTTAAAEQQQLLLKRSPSTLAHEYEAEEANEKFSEKVKATLLVASLFCYVGATFFVLLLAFALVPLLQLPALGHAFSAVLGYFTPSTGEIGYQFVATSASSAAADAGPAAASGGGLAAVARLSSLLSIVSSSSGGCSVPSIASVRGGSGGVSSSMTSAASSSISGGSSNLIFGSMSSFAASQPAPTEVLPMAKSVVNMIWADPAVQEQLQG